MQGGREWGVRGAGTGPGSVAPWGPWERGVQPGGRPPPYRAQRPPGLPHAPWRGARRGSGGFSPRGGGGKRYGAAGGRCESGWRGGGGGGMGPGVKRPHTRETPGRRLTEEEIGVTEYVSQHAGFNGIIKSRYSDFQVSEIDERGEIAKLTDTAVPEAPKRDEISEDEELLLSKYNLELLPTETWDKINSLAVATHPTTDRVEVDVTGMSKEHRTKVHDAVKKAFGDAIVGSTVTTADKKLVRFEKYRKGVRIDNRIKWVWPGDYVHFIVHKENCDTMDAAGRIAERLLMSNMKPSMLGYSGTKDRRAKSSQWFSLRKTEPRRIAAACTQLREIHVGNYRFSDTHLKLGMLKGNRFRIALRNVTTEGEQVVNEACESLLRNGFINYYGLQRFGTRAQTPTYLIGLKLLQGNFREAIDEILEEHPGPMQQCLETYKKTKDASQAVKYLRRYCHNTLEGRLLRSLAKEPNDLVGALNKLARNTRLLYVHSYQSLVWNSCASRRVRLLGLRPAVGDLVLLHPAALLHVDHELPQDDSDDEETEKSTEIDPCETEIDDQQADPDTKPDMADDQTKSTTNGDTNKDDKAKPKIPVKVLTQEDIDSGNYSISDIILPLPGYNVDYPPNMRDHYEELLTKDSIGMDMRHKIKNYSMSGAYRHVLVTPEDLEWELVRYSDPFGDLILSDLDELNNKELTSIIPDGKYKALLLSMSLPASCYATMALRELLRMDTAGDSQALQNDYHKQDKQDKLDKPDKPDKPDTSAPEQPGKEADEMKADGHNETNMKVDSEDQPERGGTEPEKRKLEDESSEEDTGDAKKQKKDE